MPKNTSGKQKIGGVSKITNPAEETRLCISVPEAAKMLGVSRNFAYELVRTKKLPVIRFGKRILIPKVALIKLLETGVNA